MPSEVEIGVWVEGFQKWVTGVTRRTTCHDIIKALLRAQNLQENSFDINDYVIVERWRKVERPLDHEQRILKVWKTWGEAVQEVRFTLRRLRNDEDKMSVESGSRLERSRRRHKLRHTSSKGATVNKKTTKDDDTIGDAMERLMRLVVAQGETIQTQLRRMHERDQQIEVFEQQMHQLRVQSLGSNYLLQSYLRESNPDKSKDDATCEEHSNDSGVVAEEALEDDKKPPTDDVEDLEARALVLAQLDSVLHRLLECEDQFSRLESALATTAVDETLQVQSEIQSARETHSATVAEARLNEQQMRELDALMCQRRTALDQLLIEEARHEEEALALQARLDRIMHLPPTAFQDGPDPPPPPTSSPPPLDDEKDSGKMDSSSSSDSAQSASSSEGDRPHGGKKGVKDSDTNSDTGLSSLHSSSDEGVYVLDTLV